LLTALATDASLDEHAISKFAESLAGWKKVRMLGSAAMSLAYVASGRAEACIINSIRYWDVAAGCALVSSAGGYVKLNFIDETLLDVFAYNCKRLESAD